MQKPAQQFDRSLVEGPIVPAVWRLAWPTMLQNIIAGVQGIIDHVMVGHYVGYTGNAAIGVSWQVILVVIVFISSLFTGMAVLVARFAGANEPEKVNRVVYQAFLTALLMSAIMGVIGYFAAPTLLDLIKAAPEVQHQALPFLRAMFVGIFGMMLFFMLSGAFRAAGDAKTPLRLGAAMTVLTIVFNVILIPRLGTIGAAYGTIASSTLVSAYGVWRLFAPHSVIRFRRGMDLSPDVSIIRSLFRFGLPTGVQGIAMNIGGVLMLRFIGSLQHSAAAQAAYAVCYTELFSLITWTSVGLLGASATIAGQNLGAHRPDRTRHGVAVASRIGLGVAAVIGLMFLLIPEVLLGVFGMKDPLVTTIGTQLLRYLSVSGFFITVALSYTGGLQGTGDTRSPLYISIVSQIAIPIGMCAIIQSMRPLHPADIWL
ncbi:MAG TPA: MATE family efflux transporter, partial [Thermoanaerobaculia bacterium]|nr:MATE family efflux transporter [Thermoanaerobaculia bacterium]